MWLEMDFPGCHPQAPCQAVPEDGATLTVNGEFVWREHLDLMLRWTPSPEDIGIEYASTANNDPFFSCDVRQGPEAVPSSRYQDRDAFAIEPDPPLYVGSFTYRAPIQVEVVRDGMPGEAMLDRIIAAEGVATCFLKVHALGTSDGMFRSGFAVKEFRVQSYADPAIREAAQGRAQDLAAGGNFTGVQSVRLFPPLESTDAEPQADSSEAASNGWVLPAFGAVAVVGLAAAWDLRRRAK